MRALYKLVPLVEMLEEEDERRLGIIEHVGAYRFAPVVTAKYKLIARIELLLLRPEPPGSLIASGGDIDNRLKTLFDALQMPRVPDEIPAGHAPTAEEDPFFCLLQDDSFDYRNRRQDRPYSWTRVQADPMPSHRHGYQQSGVVAKAAPVTTSAPAVIAPSVACDTDGRDAGGYGMPPLRIAYASHGLRTYERLLLRPFAGPRHRGSCMRTV